MLIFLFKPSLAFKRTNKQFKHGRFSPPFLSLPTGTISMRELCTLQRAIRSKFFNALNGASICLGGNAVTGMRCSSCVHAVDGKGYTHKHAYIIQRIFHVFTAVRAFFTTLGAATLTDSNAWETNRLPPNHLPPFAPPDESWANVNTSSIGSMRAGLGPMFTRAPAATEALSALARAAQRPMVSLSPRPCFFKVRMMSKQSTERSGLGREPAGADCYRLSMKEGNERRATHAVPAP
jgi:hypothetical protein